MMKGIEQSSACLIKVLKNLWIDETYLKIISSIYDKLIANIKLNGDKLREFPLTSRMEQEYPPSLLTFEIMLEVLAIAIKQEIKRERNKSQKERSQAIFADNMILYLNVSMSLLDNSWT